jgi:hypothetical protein
LVYFFPFWYVWTKKNLATLVLITNDIGDAKPNFVRQKFAQQFSRRSIEWQTQTQTQI